MDIDIYNPNRGNRKRLAFSRFLIKNYGMNIQTAYGKIRRRLVKEWELKGIVNCVRMFDSGYSGDLKNFYEQCRRTEFCRFMSKNMGMCEKTTCKRFKAFDFSEIELKGLEAIYEEFKTMQATKE